MDNNKLLNNEELEQVGGGKYIVTDKGYNLYQIAWIIADKAIKSNGKYPDEVGLVVESAFIAYFRSAEGGVGQQVACFCNSEIVHVCYE